MNKQRKLTNIRLTRKHHFRHMGLWVLIASVLVVLMNVLLYVLLMQQWGYTGGLDYEDPTASALFRRGLIAGLAIEATLFCFALALLARATSHRIAGANINLLHVCERIANGERDARLHYRKYDGLEDVEAAFNRMLDKLTGTPPGQ